MHVKHEKLGYECSKLYIRSVLILFLTCILTISARKPEWYISIFTSNVTRKKSFFARTKVNFKILVYFKLIEIKNYLIIKY